MVAVGCTEREGRGGDWDGGRVTCVCVCVCVCMHVCVCVCVCSMCVSMQ